MTNYKAIINLASYACFFSWFFSDSSVFLTNFFIEHSKFPQNPAIFCVTIFFKNKSWFSNKSYLATFILNRKSCLHPRIFPMLYGTKSVSNNWEVGAVTEPWDHSGETTRGQLCPWAPLLITYLSISSRKSQLCCRAFTEFPTVSPPVRSSRPYDWLVYITKGATWLK